MKTLDEPRQLHATLHRGTDLKTIQYLVGHDDPVTTLGIYKT